MAKIQVFPRHPLLFLELSDLHRHHQAGGGAELVVLGGAASGKAVAGVFAVVKDEGGDVHSVAKALESLQGAAGVPTVAQGSAGGGGDEGVHHDELGVGFHDPVLEGVESLLVVDGEGLVAGVEGQGGVDERGLVEQEVALAHGLFGAKPEDG
jgi:hypothetical protein